MATKPSTFLDWTDGSASYVTEPPSGQKTTGWTDGQRPPYQYMNWLFWLSDQWIQYLDDVSGGWPSSFVTDESELITALADALSAGGGVISVRQNLTLTADRVLPPNTVLIGRQGLTTITFAASGDPKLDMEDRCEVRNLFFESLKTSGDLVRMLGDSGRVINCEFDVEPADALVCVSVTGDANGIRDSVFRGVQGATAVGIEFDASSSEGFEQDNTFLP